MMSSISSNEMAWKELSATHHADRPNLPGLKRGLRFYLASYFLSQSPIHLSVTILNPFRLWLPSFELSFLTYTKALINLRPPPQEMRAQLSLPALPTLPLLSLGVGGRSPHLPYLPLEGILLCFLSVSSARCFLGLRAGLLIFAARFSG